MLKTLCEHFLFGSGDKEVDERCPDSCGHARVRHADWPFAHTRGGQSRLTLFQNRRDSHEEGTKITCQARLRAGSKEGFQRHQHALHRTSSAFHHMCVEADRHGDELEIYGVL